jgi:hypothetical protein
MADYIIDGYTFPRSDWPARGSIADDIIPQNWSRQDVLGKVDPGTILTLLGTKSPEWPLVCNAVEATKNKLRTVYTGRVAVVFKTPYNPTGYNVIMTALAVDTRATPRGDIFVCRFTLVKR